MKEKAQYAGIGRIEVAQILLRRIN